MYLSHIDRIADRQTGILLIIGGGGGGGVECISLVVFDIGRCRGDMGGCYVLEDKASGE